MPRPKKEKPPPETRTEMNVHEAKTHFSRILSRVEQGEEITIMRDGEPVAKVVPIHRPRILGQDRHLLEKGIIWISPDFDDPMSDEEFFGPDIDVDPLSGRKPK